MKSQNINLRPLQSKGAKIKRQIMLNETFLNQKLQMCYVAVGNMYVHASGRYD
jgi:hypothetical protein